MSENNIPDQTELLRVYELHQKQLAYWRKKNKQPNRLAYQRQRAREYYDKNKELVLEKRRKYNEEHREEINKKALERYYKKKEESQ